MTISHYDIHIGLEIHAQLATRSKLFCHCENRYDANPNTLTCPVCLGLPGALPVLNKRAIDFTIMLGLACNCKINVQTGFDRKNYFYPDLPKGYQITQQGKPLCQNGYISVGGRRYAIKQIHLEEDAGKSIHIKDAGLLDFNRCGIPLAEIVTDPIFSNAAEALEFLKSIKQMLEYLEISDGNMAEGSLRCDTNISVTNSGLNGMGNKVEIKNMNSFYSIQQALKYEENRQIEILEKNKPVLQESRLWNDSLEMTVSMRMKEEYPDYRYFPEPDLPDLKIDNSWIDRCRSDIPELPESKCKRFREQYRIKPDQAELLVRDKFIADYFEQVNKQVNNPDAVYRWLVNDVFKILKERPRSILSNRLKSKRLADFINLIIRKKIPMVQAKHLFRHLVDTTKSAAQIIADFKPESRDEIVQLTDKVLNTYPDEWERLQSGEMKLFHYFIGQVLRQSAGNADPDMITRELDRRLGKEPS